MRARVVHADPPPDWLHPTVEALRATGHAISQSLDATDLAAYDIALWLRPEAPDTDGVLAVFLGPERLPRRLPGLRASARADASARLAVRVLRAGKWWERAGADVYVDPRSPRRGLAAAASKIPTLVVRALSTSDEGHDPIDEADPAGPLSVVAGSARIVGRWLRDRYAWRTQVDQWQVGFRFGGDPFDPHGFTWMAPPTDRFWADPFPWIRDGRAFVFFEELRFDSSRGTVQVAEIHRDGTWEPLGTALEGPDHLSFPHLVEHEGALYLIPETAQAGRVELWRCTAFPLEWERVTVLVSEGLLDCVVFPHDGRWWLLGSRMAEDARSGWDNLYAFCAPALTGPYAECPENPLVLSVHGARSAGTPTRIGDRWIRPAQDCGGRYGRGVRFFEVASLTPGRLREALLTAWGPGPGELGRHTWNVMGDLVVTDRQVRVSRSR